MLSKRPLYLSGSFTILFSAVLGILGMILSASAACTNPSPLPTGFAAPCPVFSLSASSVPQSGTLTLSATPQAGTDYILTTAYISQGTAWNPYTLSGNNAVPNYSSALASLTLTSSQLSALSLGTHYAVVWDWLWDATAQCYKGPGLNQCNTGQWRVQSFSVTATYAYSQSAYYAYSQSSYYAYSQAAYNTSAIAYVQSAQGFSGSTIVSTQSASFPAANTAGDLIVVWTRWGIVGPNATLTDTQGNSYAPVAAKLTSTANSAEAQMFYVANVKGGANTVTLTLSAAAPRVGLEIQEYKGVSALDGETHTIDVIPPSTGSLTSSNANDLLFAASMSDNGDVGTWGAGSAYTLRQTNARQATEDRIVSSLGTYSATFTANTGTSFISELAAFKGGSSAYTYSQSSYYAYSQSSYYAYSQSAYVSPTPTPTPTETPPPQAAGYNLKWDQEFSAIDLSPDNTGNHDWYNGIWWESGFAPWNDYTITNGVLNEEWVGGSSHQSRWDSCISAIHTSSQSYHVFRYGYFEASMKWDDTTGSWPAFWMDSLQEVNGTLTNGNRDYGEIDEFEGQGNTQTPPIFYGHLHHWVNNVDVWNNDNNAAWTMPSGTDVQNTFHKYGVLWLPTSPSGSGGTMKWYFDDKLIITVNNLPSIFDVTDYAPSLCSQEGTNWAAGQNPPSYNIFTHFDWMRVWQ